MGERWQAQMERAFISAGLASGAALALVFGTAFVIIAGTALFVFWLALSWRSCMATSS